MASYAFATALGAPLVGYMYTNVLNFFFLLFLLFLLFFFSTLIFYSFIIKIFLSDRFFTNNVVVFGGIGHNGINHIYLWVIPPLIFNVKENWCAVVVVHHKEKENFSLM
jgi:hypothetical protein